MPRGFKKSIPDTKAARFLDKRSFVSTDRHWLLYGKDKGEQRVNIYLYRNPGCIPWHEGEWHHLRNIHNDFRRCDCLQGGEFIRPEAHRTKHVQVQLKSVPMEGE